MEIGTVVFSKMGRDKGKFYAIVKECEDGFAWIADGDARKLEKPKKKNLSHIKATNTVLEKIAEKLKNDTMVHDAELRSALKEFNTAEVK
jgi:ribosomal protein L14E/L6E/L27E